MPPSSVLASTSTAEFLALGFCLLRQQLDWCPTFEQDLQVMLKALHSFSLVCLELELWDRPSQKPQRTEAVLGGAGLVFISDCLPFW